MPQLRPTLRVLAAEAGVSLTTMSLALRSSPEISRATAVRLQRLATARGYRPDPHIAKLMSHLRMKAPARAAANICGLTQHWGLSRLHYKGNYGERLSTGLRARAQSLGYTFSTINIDEYPQPSQLQRVLVSRGIEGLLLLPMRTPIDVSDRLDWRMFSTVSVTSSILAPQFHSVTPHHFDNMVRACRNLTQAGFRRIGLAMSKDWDTRSNHRWTGGFAWHNQFGGTEAVKPLIEDRPGPSLDPAIFKHWLLREQPDAVILETVDSPALDEAARALPEKQRPKIVAMHWPNPGADCGIDQRVERIGTVAVEVLAAMLNRGEKGIPDSPSSTMIDGQWRPGKLASSKRRA